MPLVSECGLMDFAASRPRVPWRKSAEALVSLERGTRNPNWFRRQLRGSKHKAGVGFCIPPSVRCCRSLAECGKLDCPSHCQSTHT